MDVVGQEPGTKGERASPLSLAAAEMMYAAHERLNEGSRSERATERENDEPAAVGGKCQGQSPIMYRVSADLFAEVQTDPGYV